MGRSSCISWADPTSSPNPNKTEAGRPESTLEVCDNQEMRDLEPRDSRPPLEAGRSREPDRPQNLQEECRPAHTLILAHGDPSSEL